MVVYSVFFSFQEIHFSIKTIMTIDCITFLYTYTKLKNL